MCAWVFLIHSRSNATWRWWNFAQCPHFTGVKWSGNTGRTCHSRKALRNGGSRLSQCTPRRNNRGFHVGDARLGSVRVFDAHVKIQHDTQRASNYRYRPITHFWCGRQLFDARVTNVKTLNVLHTCLSVKVASYRAAFCISSVKRHSCQCLRDVFTSRISFHIVCGRQPVSHWASCYILMPLVTFAAKCKMQKFHMRPPWGSKRKCLGFVAPASNLRWLWTIKATTRDKSPAAP